MNQHWFRLWLGAVRQQAITWTSVDSGLCHHIWNSADNYFVAFTNRNCYIWNSADNYFVVFTNRNCYIWNSADNYFVVFTYRNCYIWNSADNYFIVFTYRNCFIFPPRSWAEALIEAALRKCIASYRMQWRTHALHGNCCWESRDFNLLYAELFGGNVKISCVLYHFWKARWFRLLKSFPLEDKDMFILQSQYHGCWWPGDKRSVDPVLPEYCGFSIIEDILMIIYCVLLHRKYRFRHGYIAGIVLNHGISIVLKIPWFTT